MRRKRDKDEQDLIEERVQKKMLEFSQARRFSDFRFTLRYQQFYVNKIVLSAISPYFAKKFEGEWESKASVDLEYEHSVEAFSAMIEYIYTYIYEQRTGNDLLPDELVDFHVELYHMAEKYGIPGLKEQVLEDLPSAVESLECPEQLYDLVKSNYIPDSELDKVFVAAVADNVHTMEAFEDLDGVKSFLAETPIFAADLICELVKRRREEA